MATNDPSRAKAATRKPRIWRWTSAHLERLPEDGQRYEVLDGALLVTPSPALRHQRTAVCLTAVLEPYCQREHVGVVVAPAVVNWRGNQLQPDIAVFPVKHAELDGLTWSDMPCPLVVVEILSPGSEQHDRFGKREAYLKLGIPEYWIVDAQARAIEVHRTGADEPLIATAVVEWAPKPGVEPLRIDLNALFGEPTGAPREAAQ